MHIVSTKQLEELEIDAIKLLYNSVADTSVYQHMLFPYFLKNGSSYNYFVCYTKDKQLLGYCIVIESYFRKLPFIKTASIVQGPICDQKDIEVDILNSICSYYKTKKYTSLSIQLRHIEGDCSEYILNKFNKNNPFGYNDISENRCTLYVDLKQSIDDIYENFTTDLKKNIKRALNKQVQVNEITTDEEIAEFASIYLKMCAQRNITLHSLDEIIDLCNFTLNENNGFLLKTSVEGKMVGGGIFINQGKKTVYHIGATDPEYKKIPLSHLLLFEAIKISHEQGQQVFDMGGVVYLAKEGEQADAINQFKLNFTSNYAFYAKKIKVVFRPVLNKIAAFALNLKSKGAD